jgi:hypothetical protein
MQPLNERAARTTTTHSEGQYDDPSLGRCYTTMNRCRETSETNVKGESKFGFSYDHKKTADLLVLVQCLLSQI